MLGVAGRKRIFMGATNREEQKWEGLEGGGMNEEKCLGWQEGCQGRWRGGVACICES